MISLLRALLHISPLIPLYLGLHSLGIAVLLLVLLCYIKVFKLRQQLVDLASRGGDTKLEASLRKALQFWHSLTYLSVA